MKLHKGRADWIPHIRRNLFGYLVVWLLGGGAAPCNGQGTLTITFDGPPVIPPGTARLEKQYSESGMTFTPISATGSGFGRVGPLAGVRPDNGTAYLQSIGSTLMFSFSNGSLFDLVFVDLAEYSTVAPDAVTVRFIGYRPNGSTIIANVTTDGIIDGPGPVRDFEIVRFGSEWKGLSRVEIPTTGWSLDNLVVSVVPEPSTPSLLALGGAALLLKRRMPHPRPDHEPSAPSVHRT